jgi:hypothetical protein
MKEPRKGIKMIARRAMVIVLAVCSALAFSVLPAAASASYYINSESTYQVANGCYTQPSGECLIEAFTGTTFEPFVWKNEGACKVFTGMTCWEIIDPYSYPTANQCLTANVNVTSWNINEVDCDGNDYQLWTNPPTGGSFGWWFSDGVTGHENDSMNWGVHVNTSNNCLYINPDLDSYGDNAKWALNS